MASSLKVISAFLVILLVFEQGCGDCENHKPSDIKVEQTNTGRTVRGQPEYKVKVSNPCHCVFTDITLKCAGFSSVEPVDPSIFKPLDDGTETCLLINGGGLDDFKPVSFIYASSTKYDLVVDNALIACS